MILLLLGCQPFQRLQGFADPDAAYEAQLQAQTREAKVYHGLVTALIARATWIDPTLAAAQGEVLGRMRLGGPGPSPVSPSLVLGIWSDQPGPLDVGVGEDAVWRVRVLMDGRDCGASVSGREPTAEDRALYPWLTPWNRVWVLALPSDCAEGSGALQISGPWASTELHWDR